MKLLPIITIWFLNIIGLFYLYIGALEHATISFTGSLVILAIAYKDVKILRKT
jgi:hypothetical protein